jgi:hypothetical protein
MTDKGVVNCRMLHQQQDAAQAGENNMATKTTTYSIRVHAEVLPSLL